MSTKKNGASKKSNGTENKITWKDPELPTKMVTRKDPKTGESKEVAQRVTPNIGGLELIQRVKTCQTVQDAIDASGLPGDVIVHRIEQYGRKLKKDGYEFKAKDHFAFWGEFKKAMSQGDGSGRKAVDLADMAALLGLTKAPKTEESAES